MSRHRITLEHAMASIDTDQFAAAVEDELSSDFKDSELDEDYCKNAGSIGDVEISGVVLDPYTPEDEKITGNFDISFSEGYYNGCRDIHWKLPWSGSASITINRSNGAMAVEIDATRNPEDDDEVRNNWPDSGAQPSISLKRSRATNTTMTPLPPAPEIPPGGHCSAESGNV